MYTCRLSESTLSCDSSFLAISHQSMHGVHELNQLATIITRHRIRFPDRNFYKSIAKKVKCDVVLFSLLNESIESPSTGIPGDGRCLFRSVVHGACLRSGKPSPSESYEKELADELRAKVVDEFIKRRADTEWFLEGDFEEYVVQMRQPHIWGGEPELLMSSHVLQAPITVYMWDKRSNCLKIIAEYGQEYGRESPILVLYHGYGHYDALQSSVSGQLSKLYKKR